jgi:hypothetical protein
MSDQHIDFLNEQVGKLSRCEELLHTWVLGEKQLTPVEAMELFNLLGDFQRQVGGEFV